MEFSLSGNALKTFARSITCLARIGNELAIQASAFLLIFHTFNSSRSAYQSITFKLDFFDVYAISGAQLQCSLLLKAICSVLRTPITNIDHLDVHLPNPDASKIQWTLYCYNGMRKAYWITCNVEPDVQHLSLDRRRLPSGFVVKARDLNRLLYNFQSTLQEITIIATEQNSLPSDAANEIGGKAVEFKSYIDPTKDIDASLHTQLWIDPGEEFVQYTHVGDPVDVTFSMKELKAFLSFCEGCEVDIHLYFDKAGEPILMAPKFGLDNGSTSNFDAALVLATMLASQLQDGNSAEPPDATKHGRADLGRGSQAQRIPRGNISSDHTRIWSELSGSSAKNGIGIEESRGQRDRNSNADGQIDIHNINAMHISPAVPAGGNAATGPNFYQPVEADHEEELRGRAETTQHGFSQRNHSNWIDAGEGNDDGDDAELCVQSTPPYHE